MIDGDGNEPRLSERKLAILKAIVEAHVELGEPVGSKYLTNGGRIPYSSATIRNEMAELEEMGYLEQPHTSAGRIPSESGYRLYVDTLVDRYRMTEREIKELKSTLSVRQAELDSLLDTAVKLASRFTECTAIAVKPRETKITVNRFEILPMDENTMVLVMVIGRTVKTKYIRSEAPIPPDAASRLAAALNRCITGLTPSEITIPIVMDMENEMGELEYLVSPVVKAVCEAVTSFDGGDIKTDGINKLLTHPDFYDFDRLRTMLQMFESKEDLINMLPFESISESNGVKILIGRENTAEVMDNSTLVFKTITRDGIPVGAIGIIGPTRMDYGRVIDVIDRLTDGVSRLITGGEKDDNN